MENCVNIKDICACPNLSCPNHGKCDQCTSRHVRLGYLNYCAFHTMVPALEKTIEAHPDSVVSKELEALIAIQSNSYNKLMEKNGLTKENQDRLYQLMATYSKH